MHADARSCVLLGPRWSGRLSARTSGDWVVALGCMPEGPGEGTGLLLFSTPLQLPPVAGGAAAKVSLRADWAAAEGEAVRLRGLGIFVRIQVEGVEALLRGMAASGHLEVVGPVGVFWDVRGGAEAAARTLRCLRG